MDDTQVDTECDNQFEADENEEVALLSQIVLHEEPFQWNKVFTESAVTMIMSFSILYFILEVNEVSNYKNGKKYNIINDVVETVYLAVAFVAIIMHLHRFRWNPNLFFSLPFDNYPMFVVLIICAMADMAYYFMNYLSIGIHLSWDKAAIYEVSRIFSTSLELLFNVALLPFVVVCVCNYVRSNSPVLKQKVKVTLLLAIGGCLMIFMRKVTIKIERDIPNETSTNNKTGKFEYLHNTISSAEQVLELVDITYIFIALIFLIDPLRYVTKLETEEVRENFDSTAAIERTSFLESLSFIRFRWPTLVLSLVIVSLFLLISYMITSILETSSLSKNDKMIALIVYLSFTIVTYMVGIFYATTYYFWDIKQWRKKDVIEIHNDEHFNRLTSPFQIIYSSGMVLSLIQIYQSNNTSYKTIDRSLFYIEIFDFFFLAVQVLVQASCINAAIHREVKNNPMKSWRSRLFPPIALAFLNFGYMVISVIYSQHVIFITFEGIHLDNYLVYLVIKDVALPITILHRLHGMTFFINLSIQQWHSKT